MNDKKAKQPCCLCDESFSGLDRRSSEPQHPLKPKPNPEQGPHLSSVQWRLKEMRKLQEISLKLAEVGSWALRKRSRLHTIKVQGETEVLMKKLQFQKIYLRWWEWLHQIRDFQCRRNSLLLEEECHLRLSQLERRNQYLTSVLQRTIWLLCSWWLEVEAGAYTHWPLWKS